MGLFDDVLGGDQTLIKNDDALDYDFVPKLLPYREAEQKHLATCIKPLFQGRSGRNLFIHGAPGIGKTAATRHVLRDLEETTDEVHALYINCWQQNTTYKVLVEICEQLGYKFTQNKKSVELLKVVGSIVNKSGAIFVFDEIDKAEEIDFLYFILEEIYKKSIFLLTNYKSWLLELDERIRSRLVPEIVEFRQYTRSETEGIMKERLSYAFPVGVWDEDSFQKVVDKAAAMKDIRSGLFLLKESALIAENRASKKIGIEDVSAAIKKLDDFTIKNSAELDSETKVIFSLVKDNSGKKIGDLFSMYQNSGGNSSYKTFQRKIAKLEEGKFVKITKRIGAGGNTTIVEKKLSDF